MAHAGYTRKEWRIRKGLDPNVPFKRQIGPPTRRKPRAEDTIRADLCEQLESMAAGWPEEFRL